jgi:hypothetical protein
MICNRGRTAGLLYGVGSVRGFFALLYVPKKPMASRRIKPPCDRDY